MRILAGLVPLLSFAVLACSGPKAKPESPLVNEGPAVPETCCCKHTPIASSDGQPVYEMVGRMDCSSKQGECVAEVQCEGTSSQPSGPPEPGVE
jgi:hypothetical protein